MSRTLELITLKSGVRSLRSLEHGETFHPGIGPRIEANLLHVKQQRLVERCLASSRFVIWDVGLGAAANALAALEALQDCGEREVELHSFDKTTAPLEFALKNADQLGYLKGYEEPLLQLIETHAVDLEPRIRWRFHLGDFRAKGLSDDLPAPNAIFYDPYSAKGNPELWSLEHFTALRRRLDPDTPCLLTNYTRSTAARVSLLLAGFFVGVGCEIGEKAETTIASNCLDLLPNPLGSSWLARARRSGNGAPLRSGAYALSPISDEDFNRVQRHPQFLSSGLVA